MGTLVVAELFLYAACSVSGKARWALAAPWERTEHIWDPVLKFRGNPDHPEHDTLGFRNGSVPTPIEIVTIGDSQTYGIGVKAGEEWPKRLHALTGRSVYNLSMSGWGPVQYLANVDRALEFEPQIVAIGLYLGNDIYDAYKQAYSSEIGRALRDPDAVHEIEKLESSQPLDVKLPQLPKTTDDSDSTSEQHTNPLKAFVANRSQLYALARGFWYLLAGYDSGFSVWNIGSRDDYWLQSKQFAKNFPHTMIAFESEYARTILNPSYRLAALNIEDPRIHEGLAVSFKVLKEMRRRCSEKGAKLLVVVLPTKELTFAPFLISADLAQKARQTSERVVRLESGVRRQLFDFFVKEDIAYVDVLPPLQKTIADAMGNPYFESLNGHFSRHGQSVIARSVAAHSIIQGDATAIAKTIQPPP